jgi:type I protein arginine methyltransferase
MYSISAYGRMIADNSRLAAYAAGLQRAIKPGCVVADLGTGPGFFALLACQLGAKRVYAIEPDNVIQVAREAAIANGFENKIEFIQDFSTRVTLPESVDVIVSDLRGILPWFQQHLPSIRDARSRLLATDGILIPKRDILWAAPVEAEETYEELVGPWSNDEYKLVLTPALKLVTNTFKKAHVKTSELLGQPVSWYTLDYSEFDQVNVQASFSLAIKRSGTIHGFAVWFDSEVFDGIFFSNGPDNEKSLYGNAFFPFPESVGVKQGDIINLKLRADLIGEDYVWQWDTTIANSDDGRADTTFKQSTLFGAPLSPSQLKKRAATFLPQLTTDGQIDRLILTKFDGKSTLEEIARAATSEFPERFAEFVDALDFVAELSIKYSK